MEIWKPIPGYEGFYEASSEGRIRSVDRRITGKQGTRFLKGKIIQPGSMGNGYTSFALCKNGHYRRKVTHRAICEAFHGPNDGMDACHIDGVPGHDRPDNLRWGTRKQNMADTLTHGTRLVGEKVAGAKLTAEKVREIRILAARGETQRSIGAKFGVSQGAISLIVLRQRWDHIQ